MCILSSDVFKANQFLMSHKKEDEEKKNLI